MRTLPILALASILSLGSFASSQTPAPEPAPTPANTATATSDTHRPVIVQPKILNTWDPEYTEDARRKLLQGTVQIRFTVDEKGHPKSPVVKRGLGDGLNESALHALSLYRFKPATCDGAPCPMEQTIEVTFQRSDAPSFSLPKRNPNVTEPVLISQVSTSMTPRAIADRIENALFVFFTVNKQGIPEDIHIMNPLGDGLDENAIAAVKQFRYKPAMESGKPVNFRMAVKIAFNWSKQNAPPPTP